MRLPIALRNASSCMFHPAMGDPAGLYRVPILHWRLAAWSITFHLMETLNLDTSQPPSPETEAERQARISWEAEGIAEAEASLAAGLYVDADDIDAWIDSIGTDHELPPPPTRRR